MAAALRFGDILEAADLLSEEEQETLLEVLRRRLAERRRSEIAADVEDARREHERGATQAVSPEDLMRDILA